MRLAEFGKDESGWNDPSLSDVIGYIAGLIERECDRTDGSRKHGGQLDLRLAIVERASELLQIAEAGDVRIMRATLNGAREAV